MTITREQFANTIGALADSVLDRTDYGDSYAEAVNATIARWIDRAPAEEYDAVMSYAANMQRVRTRGKRVNALGYIRDRIRHCVKAFCMARGYSFPE